MGKATEKACFSAAGVRGWMVVHRTSLARMLLVPRVLAPLMVTPVESSSQMPATRNSSWSPVQPWGLVMV